METTWQVAKMAFLIFGKCLLYTSPLLLIGYVIYRINRGLKARFGPPDESLEADPEDGAAPSDKAEDEDDEEQRLKRPRFEPPPGWDPRDDEESWDRERKRRYGRHQHRHGRHHRRS